MASGPLRRHYQTDWLIGDARWQWELTQQLDLTLKVYADLSPGLFRNTPITARAWSVGPIPSALMRTAQPAHHRTHPATCLR
jgi:hypothetical protein